jgi:hypothetical protein
MSIYERAKCQKAFAESTSEHRQLFRKYPAYAKRRFDFFAAVWLRQRNEKFSLSAAA